MAKTKTKTNKSKAKGPVKGSEEWKASKRAGKAALDERLGTARKVNKRDDRG